jgi:hypothetical protein
MDSSLIEKGFDHMEELTALVGIWEAIFERVGE